MNPAAVCPPDPTPVTRVPGTVVLADTTTVGGVANLPTGRATHTSRGVFAAVGVMSRVPDAVFRIPVIDPSAPNVSGPIRPDPSPLNSRFPTPDFKTAGVESGKVFVVGRGY